MPPPFIGGAATTGGQQAVRSPYQIWVGWPPESGSAPPPGMDPNIPGGGAMPPAGMPTDPRPTIMPGDPTPPGDWGPNYPGNPPPGSPPVAPDPGPVASPPPVPDFAPGPGDSAGRDYGRFRQISQRGGPEFRPSNTQELIRRAAARRLGLD